MRTARRAGWWLRKSDDTLVTYRETVRRHFITSIATCETTAQHRTELLEEFFRYRKSAIEEGSKEPVREYILSRKGDVTTVDKLAQLLVDHGVEVKRATAAFSNGGKPYPAGSYVVSCAQPAKRLIRVLMDTQVSMAEEFLKAEEARRKHRQPSEIYDVTAWSLPMQYNVEAVTTGTVSDGKFEPVVLGNAPKGVVNGKAEVAYVIPWGTSGAAKMLTALLHSNYKIVSNDRPFTLDGKHYEKGALVLKVKDNPAALEQDVRKLAQSTGADVDAHNSSWADVRADVWQQPFQLAAQTGDSDRLGSSNAGRFGGAGSFRDRTAVRISDFGDPHGAAGRGRSIEISDHHSAGWRSLCGVIRREWRAAVEGLGAGGRNAGGSGRRDSISIRTGDGAAFDGGRERHQGRRHASGRWRTGDGWRSRRRTRGSGRNSGGSGSSRSRGRAVARKFLSLPPICDLAEQPTAELPGSLHGALAKVKVDLASTGSRKACRRRSTRWSAAARFISPLKPTRASTRRSSPG